MRSLAMILMEPGGQWPRQVNQADVDVVALAAAKDESDAAVVQRAKQRIGRMSHGLRLVVVACNAESDEHAMNRRWTWARALLAAVLQAGNARLVLSVGSGAPTELVRKVRALTSSLRETVAESPRRVSMRLGSQPGVASSSRRNVRKLRWGTAVAQGT